MAKRRKRIRRSNVSLPWERRGAFFRGLFRGPRWKVLVGAMLISGAVFVVWSTAASAAETRHTRIAIAEVRRAIREFRSEVGRCPRTTVELVHPPMSRNRFLSSMPRDGWGQPLYVQCPSQNNPDDADVLSPGPSGSFFVDDNVY